MSIHDDVPPDGRVIPIGSGKRKPKRPAPDAGARPTYARLCRIMRADYGARLSYNSMRETACLDGRAIRDADVGRLREDLEVEHGLAFAADNMSSAIRQVAEEHAFHPVRDYLRALRWDGVVRLPRVGPELLGVGGPLVVSMLRKWFISAVARGLEPGCKADTSLVLVGPQGFRKSSFFDALGGEWYSDTDLDISSKDGLMQLASSWIYEWPEIDRMTTRRHSSDLKAFLTGRIDSFRPPYGRAIIQHPRGCVVVGTTNEPRYLTDSTGSRRFWTVRCDRLIAFDELRRQRDQLWAEAVLLYDANEPWWLSDAEEAAREKDANENHAVDSEDPWLGLLDHWLSTWFERPRDCTIASGDALTLKVLLGEGLKLGPHQQDKPAQARACKAMRDLGFHNPICRIAGGKYARVWTKLEPPSAT